MKIELDKVLTFNLTKTKIFTLNMSEIIMEIMHSTHKYLSEMSMVKLLKLR